MRRLLGVVLVVAFVAAACAGNDDETAPSVPLDAGGSEESALDQEDGSTATAVTMAVLPEVADEDLGESAWQQYRDLVAEEGHTPRAALLQFALIFGPVDGIDAPPVDESVPRSGTHAIRDIADAWDELSGDEQVLVATTLARWFGLLERPGGAEPDDAPGSSGGGGDGGDDEESLGIRSLRAPVAVQPLGEDGEDRPEVDVPDAERRAWESRLATAAAWLEERLPHDDPLDYELFFLEPDGEGGAAWTVIDADTQNRLEVMFDLIGVEPWSIGPGDCPIVLEDVRGMTNEAAIRSTMAHELFHCWSLTRLGILRHNRTPDWVQEGLASWVGETYAGGSSFSTNWWRGYLATSGREGSWTLWGQDYQAIGFWSAVDQFGGDLFPRIPGILDVAAGGGDIGSYEGAMATLSPEAQASIASSAARMPWGPEWGLVGPGIRGTGRQPSPESIGVGEQDSWSAPIGSQVNRSYEFEPPESGWFVVTVAATGSGRFRWESGASFVVAGGSAAVGYCLRGPCVCESTGEPPPGEFESLVGELSVATAITGLPGVPSTASVQVLGEDDLCEEDECPAAPILEGVSSFAAAQPVEEEEECVICPAGTWAADFADVQAYIASTPGPDLVGGVVNAGSITVTFGSDFTFEQVMADVDITGTFAGRSGQRFQSGITRGLWTITDDGTYLLQITEVTVTTQTTVDGITVGPTTTTIDPANLGDVFTFEPTCTGDRLDLVANYFIPVPRNWTRV